MAHYKYQAITSKHFRIKITWTSRISFLTLANNSDTGEKLHSFIIGRFYSFVGNKIIYYQADEILVLIAYMCNGNPGEPVQMRIPHEPVQNINISSKIGYK